MKNPQDKTQEAESLREDFLDHFCAPLVGSVPYQERRAVRQEIASHLEAMATEYEWQGEDPLQAVRSALYEMGEPWVAGEAWLVEWSIGCQTRLSSLPLTRVALARPFAFFGVATVVNLLVLELYVFAQSDRAVPPGLTTLPTLLTLLIFASPFLAGVMTGYRHAAPVSRSVLPVLLGLTIYSTLIGLVMLPKTEVLFFAALQGMIWIPVGVGTARFTAALVRSHRRSSFLRRVGLAKRTE